MPRRGCKRQCCAAGQSEYLVASRGLPEFDERLRNPLMQPWDVIPRKGPHPHLHSARGSRCKPSLRMQAGLSQRACARHTHTHNAERPTQAALARRQTEQPVRPVLVLVLLAYAWVLDELERTRASRGPAAALRSPDKIDRKNAMCARTRERRILARGLRGGG